MVRAVISGGLGAIGLAVAKRLAEDGWSTVLIDIAEEPDSPLPDGAEYHRLDITDHDAVRRTMESVPDYDAYVGVAGIGATAPFLEETADGWRRLFEINLVAHFNLAQLSARRWVDQGVPGSMLLISSWIDSRPWPGTAAYASSKAALAQLTRTAALELAPYGIRANSIAPGILGEGMAGEEAMRDPEYARRAAQSVPLGRLQTAREVADAAAFMLSPQSSYLTGSRLVMDGGATLVSGAGVQA